MYATRRLVPAALILVMTALLPPAAFAGLSYELTRLPLPPGVTAVGAADMNDAGQVVVSVEMDDSGIIENAAGGSAHRVFFYEPSGDMIDLGGVQVNYPYHYPYVSINNRGDVVVATMGSDFWGNLVADNGSYLWNPSMGGGSTALSQPVDLGPWTSAFMAFDIDDAGNMVGAIETDAWVDSDFGDVRMLRPVVYTANQELIWLDSPADRPAFAFRVNNHGDVLGRVRAENPWSDLWIFDAATAYWPLGYPLDSTTPWQELNDPIWSVMAINDQGAMLGRWLDQIAVLEPDGTLRGIDIEGMRLAPNRLNDAGVVIGMAFDVTSYTHDQAFISHPDWGTHLLADLLTPGTGPDGAAWLHAVNQSGRILGAGTFDGQPGPFILTPIPEPAAPLACAAVVLWAACRRRCPTA